MSMFQSMKKISFSKMIAAAVSMAIGNKPPKKVEYHRPSRNFRGFPSAKNPSGSKIRRAIHRGNFGVVNKHGVVGAAVAEMKRERWFKEQNKPVFALSTTKI